MFHGLYTTPSLHILLGLILHFTNFLLALDVVEDYEVVVYGACLSLVALFGLAFTKQEWKSQRHGEVEPFPPVFCIWMEKLSYTECNPRPGQPLALSLHLSRSLSL